MDVNHYHVLLVEDNLIDVKAIKQFFKLSKAQTTFQVQSADSLKTAIDYLRINDVSAILLDLNLSDSFGIDTYLHIKKVAPQIPIVILTATDDERLALLAVRQGAQDYLLKTDLSCSILTRAIEYSVERKAIQNHLAAVKAGQLAIIENTEDSIWSVDVHGNFNIVNSKFKKFYRSITGNDLRIGDNMLVKLPESFHNDWKNLLVKALDGNQLLVYQSYKLDNFKQHDYEIAVNPIINNNQITGASFFARNITDRRTFEKKMMQSEKAYRMLVESVNEGVVMINNENLIQVINNKLLKQVEFDENEIIGLDYRLLLARTSKLTNENITAFILNSEEPFQIILKSKAGKKLIFSVKGTPLMDENGEMAGALLMHSSMVKNNVNSKQSKEFSHLVDKLNEGLIYVDNDSKIQYANSKYCELVGLKHDDLIDKPLFIDMVDDRTERILNEKKLLYGAALADNFELKLTKRSGEDLWVMVNGSTVYDENNQHIGTVCTLADITKRKVQQVRKEINNTELSNLILQNTKKIELPVNNIKEQIQNKSSINDIVLNVEYLYKQLNELKEVVSMRHEDVKSEIIETKKLVNEIWLELQNNKHIERVTFKFTNDCLRSFNSDNKLIRFILTHIIQNTIKNIHNTTEIIDIELLVQDSPTGTKLFLSDNRKDLQQKEVEGVYNLFGDEKSKKESNWSSLHLVLMAIDKLEGTINAKSLNGEGTEIEIHLPELR